MRFTNEQFNLFKISWRESCLKIGIEFLHFLHKFTFTHFYSQEWKNSGVSRESRSFRFYKNFNFNIMLLLKVFKIWLLKNVWENFTNFHCFLFITLRFSSCKNQKLKVKNQTFKIWFLIIYIHAICDRGKEEWKREKRKILKQK